MDELFIHQEGSFKTPLVDYNAEKKLLLIEGRLIPEDPLIFFSGIENWLGKFNKSNQIDLNIELYIYYYNTSSLKRMVDFLTKLEKINSEGKNINIVWKCDDGDEDNIEDGKDFQKMLKLNFEIVLVEK